MKKQILTNPGLQKAPILTLLLFFAMQVLSAQTWTGTVNTDWNTPGNWDGGAVPLATGDVTIPDVANDPTIMAGTMALAKSVMVESGTVLTIAAMGSLTIDGSATQGILNLGTVQNNGTINIGQTTSTGTYGIDNQATFNNNTGGQIKIDRSTLYGLYNSSGTFTNQAAIIIGGTGGPGSAGSNGIKNEATFNNNTGGAITIDRSHNIGLFNNSGPFNNQGTITIGATDTPGFWGIANQLATFTNNTGGEIKIDRTITYGLFNHSGTYNNQGNITIGAAASVGSDGILNFATFNNNSGGQIKIDRSTNIGLENGEFGTFNNQATITIGAVASVGNHGIQNAKTFNNNAGGQIKIDRSTLYGLYNSSGTFTNQAAIIIGGTGGPGSAGSNGIKNEATFNNNTGGAITIDRSHNIGLFNNSGPFNNQGTITIGATDTPGFWGIANQLATFTNNTGGEIKIDRTITYGLFNHSGTYNNQGNITIGATASVGSDGILNFATFNNNSGGQIKIDRSTNIGLENGEFGTFNNQATITIGAVASVGNHGIQNAKTFNNNAGGLIKIDRSSESGINNYAGTFTNHANITLGQVASVGSTGINNLSTFDNALCDARINIVSNSVITNSGTFTNAGGITENATGNSSITNNTGVIQNLNGGTFTTAGNPPITTPGPIDVPCCTLPIFTACPTPITTNTQGNLCLAAVTYSVTASGNPAPTFSYTFTGATSGSGSGTGSGSNFNKGITTITVKATNTCGAPTCVFTITVNDVILPTITCPANINTNNNPATACSAVVTYATPTATDNCGIQSVVLQSGLTSGATYPVGTRTNVWKATDLSNNITTCAFTVTVVDATPPTLLCKNATLSLNAAGQATLLVTQVNNGSYDNCNIAVYALSQSIFTCANVGSNNVTLYGRDQGNNLGQCIAVVTVNDPIAPSAKCKNVTANLDDNGLVIITPSSINNGSTDNCSLTLTANPDLLTCSNLGQNTVTLKATDAGGNTATCTAKVTVRDVTGPTANCENPTIYLDDSGSATLSAAQVDNGSSDNCGMGSMSVNKTAFDCSHISGTQSVTLSMTDVNGNAASCTSNVTVKDAMAPTAICEDMTVELGSNGTVVVYGADLASYSYDNCSVYSYSPVAKVYTTAHVGANNLTITVKDWSSNAGTCVSVVTVVPAGNGDFQQPGGNGKGEKNGVGDFAVYPNPSSGEATMAFQLPAEQAFSFRIFDLTGRLVYSQEDLGVEGENTMLLHLNGLVSGAYLIDFQSDNWKEQKRLMLQR